MSRDDLTSAKVREIEMKMKAYQIVEWGRPAEFVDVEKPSPGPNEVLVRMKGAGLCRTDLDLMAAVPGVGPYTTVLPQGFTLGHENAGTVEAVGKGVTDLVEGANVIVHHIHSCGNCVFCLRAVEQHCSTYARGAMSLTRGLGLDGGLAPYMLVPRRELLPIGLLDPVDVAPLTDAGVTAYHAVKTVADRLRPGTVATVIGVGGLGSYGVQLLKLMTEAKIVALDTSPERLAIARSLGADHAVCSNDDASDAIMDLTHGYGSDVILDFVGSNATLAIASRVSRPQGRIVIVGIEGGSLNVGWGSLATSCEVAISMGSTRADLMEIGALAEQGKLKIDKELFAFEDVELAYDRLRKGQLVGRAVVTFP